MDRPKRNALAGLPDEATLEILARAPFRSVCRSKCVAKAWRDLIADPLNRGRLPQTLQGFFSIFYRMGNLEHSFMKYSTTSVPLDIDPCLSFLTKAWPDTESLFLVDYCNGLLLFERCRKSNLSEVLGYVVCNPATKHWGTVPVCPCCPPPKAVLQMKTYLVFDPARAVSPHFHLIQFWKGGCDEEAPLTYEEIEMLGLSVHTYSSETGVWSHSQTEQGQLEGWRHRGILKCGFQQRTFVNGSLHLIVLDLDQHQIVAVDVEGKTKRIIPMPPAVEGRRWYETPCIGASQGRLHYINQDFDAHRSRQVQSSELFIWELQDYNTQEWVLKDTVSFLSLFGRMTARMCDFDIVIIHPDRNVVFFVEQLNGLIAYDMDSKEVSVVSTLGGNLSQKIVPYIPYFSESPALTDKN